MRTLWLTSLLAAALVPFAPRLAVAGNPPAAPAAAPGAAEGAKEHYERAKKLYDLNRFDEAVKEFEAAYELNDQPVLLYNIAQSYRLAGKLPESVRFYKSYLRNFQSKNGKDAPNKVEVEGKIVDIEKQITDQQRADEEKRAAEAKKAADEKAAAEARAAAAAATAAAAGRREGPTPPHPGKNKIIAGAVVAVVGLGAIVGGIVMGLQAISASNDQMNAKSFDPTIDNNGKTSSLVGGILDGVGGAALAAGIGVAVWGAMAKPKEASDKPAAGRIQIAPAVSSNYAGGSLRLSF
jgi:tetratricopeptide (TPR) repeat protein